MSNIAEPQRLSTFPRLNICPYQKVAFTRPGPNRISTNSWMQQATMKNWCQAMVLVDLSCDWNWHIDFDATSGTKLTLFWGVWTFLLLSDYFISSIFLTKCLYDSPGASDGPWVSGYHTFELGCVNNIGTLMPHLWNKTYKIFRSDTISVAARIFHII